MYIGQTRSTILEEKIHNPRLTKSREEFIKIMTELKLSYPKQIGNIVAVSNPQLLFIFLSFR